MLQLDSDGAEIDGFNGLIFLKDQYTSGMRRISRIRHKFGIILLGLSTLACRLAIQGVNQPVPVIPTPTHTTFVTRTFTPTFTRTPTSTPVPTATPTETPTPTPVLFVDQGTALPEFLQSITLENADRVSALAEWKETSVSDMEWTPDGQLLAVANASVINLYDMRSRNLLRTLYPTKEGIIDIIFSPRGTWLLAGARQGDEKSGFSSSLDLWVGPNWKPLGLLYGVAAGLTSMSFLPDGQILAVAYASPFFYGKNSIDFWAATSWTINTSMDTGKLQEVAFSPDGRFFATSPDRFAIQVWDLTDKVFLYRIPTSFTGAVNRFAFSPDGSFLASGHYDGMVRIWDLEANELALEFDSGAMVQSLVYSPDGKLIVTGGSFENSRVQIWSSGSGTLLRSLENDSGGIQQIRFSPDQRYLVSGSYDGTIRLWGIRP